MDTERIAPEGTSPASISRRSILRKFVMGSMGLVGAPFFQKAKATGDLKILFTAHWIPGADARIRKVIEKGCAKLGAEAQIDFVPTQGSRYVSQVLREAQQKQGHDLLFIIGHHPFSLLNALESVDEVAEELFRRHGRPPVWVERYCKVDGAWKALPAPYLNHTYPHVARLDYWKQHAGIDLREIFPAMGQRNEQAVSAWTWQTYLEAARKLHKAGHPVGHPISPCTDSNDWLTPLFMSFGSFQANPKGELIIHADGMGQALEWMVRLTEVMPAEVYEWDDTGNNYHLIAGGGSSIFNPPSAWALARLKKPEVATQLWHHDVPAGPAGRFRGILPFFMGTWHFSPHKETAKKLMLYLWEPEAQSEILNATQGFDIPLLPRYHAHPVWQTATPPQGTLYNYPIHGDEQYAALDFPVPNAVLSGIYSDYLLPNLVTRIVHGGERIDAAIAWAKRQLDSYRDE